MSKQKNQGTEPSSLERSAERRDRLLVLDRRDATVLGCAFLFIVLMFAHALFAPSAACLGSEKGDGRTQFYPWRVYGFGRLARGEFPLWNPYTFAGMPFVGNLQSAMFYPTNWLCLILPPYRAMNWSVAINLFLSLAFTYGWARMTGRGRLGALVAGATYAFAAPQFLRVHEGHWCHLCAMPWIPWLLACAEALVVCGGFLPVALGAGGLAIQAFAGHPQYMFYGSIAASLYFVVRLMMEPQVSKRWRPLLGRLIGFAAIFPLGMILAAVQMLPAAELLSVSQRSGSLGYDWIAQYSLPPENLLTQFAPWLFGNVTDVAYWGRWNAWEGGAYLGIVSFALALFGSIAGDRRWKWLAFGMTALLLLFALGGNTPLLRWMLSVPGFGLFRGLSRFAAPMSVFFGLLAGIGADALLPQRQADPSRPPNGDSEPKLTTPSAHWRAAFVAVLCLGAAMWLVTLATARPTDRAPDFWDRFMDAELARGERPVSYHDSEQLQSDYFRAQAYRAAWGSLARSTMLVTLIVVTATFQRRRKLSFRNAGIIVALLAACDFWTYGRPYLVTFDGSASVLTEGGVGFLRSRKQPYRITLGDLYGGGPLDPLRAEVPCVEGVEPNVPERFSELFWRALDQPLDTKKTSYHVGGTTRSLGLLRLLNWRFVLSSREGPSLGIPGMRTVYRDDKLRVDELPGWLPRARLVHRVLQASKESSVEPGEALEKLLRLRSDRAARIEHDVAGPLGTVSAEERSKETAEFVARQPEFCRLRVNALAAGLLVLSDIDYPGWKAFVDGIPTPIYRADYLCRGVYVPAGEHTVEFVYAPLSFRLGAWLSGVGWAGLAVYLSMVYCIRRRRRPINRRGDGGTRLRSASYAGQAR